MNIECPVCNKQWDSKLKRMHRRFGLLVEVALFLFLCAIITATTESQAEESKSGEDTKLWLSLRSVHYEHNSRYNNNNLGIYVEHQRVLFGIYKNSFNNTAGLVAYDMGNIAQAGPIDIGWTIGAALGYEQQPVIVAPALTFTVERVRIVTTPYVSTMAVKIGEW